MLNSLSKNNGSKFLNFLQPTMGLDYVKINWEEENRDFKIYRNFITTQTSIDTNYIYKKFREICLNLDYCIDISNIAAPGAKENIFSDSRHHNEKGNLIIAKEIYNILKAKMSN